MGQTVWEKPKPAQRMSTAGVSDSCLSPDRARRLEKCRKNHTLTETRLLSSGYCDVCRKLHKGQTMMWRCSRRVTSGCYWLMCEECKHATSVSKPSSSDRTRPLLKCNRCHHQAESGKLSPSGEWQWWCTECVKGVME